MPKFLLSIIAILLAFSFHIGYAQAQFKERGPKGDQLRYNGWLQKQHRFNGFKLNRGQRNALGLSNGFLGTGIGANKSRSKKPKNRLSSKELEAIKENHSNTIKP